MCGICGIVGKRDEAIVEKMLQVMKHRGPDEKGIFSINESTLGMVRLSILDLSARGHQPMHNDTNTIWIVYNGEMYNFKAEREILENKGVRFLSNSDTEVVLKMYEHYGLDFLNRIRGMFSLAILDKRNGSDQILLARDPFGIKPLLYSFKVGILTFASELKAMLKSPYVSKELDYSSIQRLLTFGSLWQPDTMLKDVKMLMPGHYISFNNSQLQIHQYSKFEINKFPELKKMPYPDQVELFKELLSESVKLHMVSDVPIGAFLSGGLDSSLLVANMARHSNKVISFCVGYGEEGATIDESDAAQKIADHIGTEHHKVIISSTDFKDHLPNIVRALDQPSVDGVNSYFVSMAARKFATVAISGTGGDEFFVGYPWFYNAYQKFNNQAFSKRLSTNFIQKTFNSSLLQYLRNSTFGKIIEYGAGYHNVYFFLASYISLFQQFGTNRVLSAQVKNMLNDNRSMASYFMETDKADECDLLQRLSMLSFKTYTQNQLLRDIDATSLAHSLEVRVPFIDKKIVDFALSLPETSLLNPKNYGTDKADTYKNRGVKKILIDAGKGLVPQNLDMQKKKGFQMPFDQWMKSELTEIIDDVTTISSINKRGIFNYAEILIIKNKFYSGRESWNKLWLILIIELWCREFIDNE